MALRDIFKLSRKTFFNPTGWLDYQGIKAQNATIWSTLKSSFGTVAPLHDETFEQALERLNLTEADVKEGAERYRAYAWLFVSLGTLIFAYSFYLLFRYGTLTGFLLSLSASALLFAQAFKYDFWSLQMRKRRLGLTFTDWKNSFLGVKGSSND